jgi:ATP-binding cassette subfamily B protein
MQLQMLVTMGLRMIAYAPIVGIGGIIRAIGKSSSMWWVIALAVGILIVIVLIVFNIAIPKFKLMQKLVDRLNLVSRERLSGIMVIRAFCRQDREEQRFDEANRKLAENMLFVNRVMVLLMPVMTLIMSGVSLLITWFGAHYVASGALQVGDMMAFMQYAIQIVFSFLMLSFVFIMLPRAAVSADRIAEVLATRSSVIDPDQAESFGRSFTGSIEFRSVSFRYPGAEEDVLKDVSFTVPPGQTTAIIGTTGSGKSSLVNLVPRLYDVTSGSVLVDGIDVRKLPQTVLRDKIGFVPQKAVLFSGTIESNLRYADEGASTEAIDSALRISQAAEFVTADPQGIHAPVSQGGANVSGGQRQRLAIARALVKKPPIYIFDDSFSALDLKTDQALRRALKEETAGATVIMVTQRVATIKNADRIVVLDEGRVVGIGRHAELLDNCEAYREIATSQLTEEELL